MSIFQIVVIVAVVLALGIVILPLFNKWQFKRLPAEQQVLAIMKQANKLVYWKNVSNGITGNLFFVKNKRKILVFPWKLDEQGRMVVTKSNPFDKWDYPEEQEILNDDEVKQAVEELEKYSKNSVVKIVFNNPLKNNETQSKPQN